MLDALPPGAFGIEASEDLIGYLAHAQLPNMVFDPACPKAPPRGHKSHVNLLRIRPERHRLLERMICSFPGTVVPPLREFIQRHIPDVPLAAGDIDPENKRRLAVPCNPHFNVIMPKVHPVKDINSFAVWLIYLPLQTVLRTMHIVFPETRETWSVTVEDTDEDSDMMHTYAWASQNPLGQKTVSAVIMSQPPWILSQRDVQSFLDCTRFPSFDEMLDGEMKATERLWAKIYDTCTARETPWFVLTNYHSWVFGVFAPGWARAFLVDIRHHGSLDTTVLECLFYWIASSMHYPGAFVPAEVPERLSDHVHALTPPTPGVPYNPRPAPSESDWGEDSEMASSAGVAFSSVSRAVSDETVMVGGRRPSYGVRDWLDSEEDPSNPVNIPDEGDTQSQTSTVWSSFTATTKRQSDWQTVNVSLLRRKTEHGLPPQGAPLHH